MSDFFSHLIAAATAIPTNTDNPMVAVILEIIFFAIVLFTLVLSVAAIIGGIWQGLQQWREDLHARWEQRRAGAKPS